MNKSKTTLVKNVTWLITVLSAIAAAGAARADQTKANNNTALQSGGSWVSGTAPGPADNAIWNATVSTAANCTNTLGASVTWKGIVITNPVAPISINGSATLAISNGISMGNASQNLVLNCGTVSVLTNQTWTVAAGKMITTGSATNGGSVSANNNVVTLAGGGNWSASGTGDNGSLGVTVSAGTFYLNKASGSSAHAVGGPGLTVNSGATAQCTGTGGNQIYSGAGITINGTLDMYGDSEAINGLNGSGTITTTRNGGAAVLSVGTANAGGTFSGTIQTGTTNGSITLNKNGTGSQSVAGITLASGSSGPFVHANGGTLTLNGTVDNGSVAVVVANGATLLLDKTSGASVHAVGGGGLIVNSGGLAQITGTGGDQIYNFAPLTVAGTFDLNGNSELVGSLTFNGGTLQNSAATSATLSSTNGLTMNGNVTVNAPNAATGTTVILTYAGPRSGPGWFVGGNLPAGASILDDALAQTVSIVNNAVSTNFPQAIVPTLNSHEIVVAATTPQMYGAKGDGVTDDSAAFQNAINAVFNSGHYGGGVVYVPSASYVFSNNITVPTGVTLHGDWTDWTTGTNGLVGTTFCVRTGAGQARGTPFITLGTSAALRDVNIWYPDQNPNSIAAYPYSVKVGGDAVVQNVVLVNSYQGLLLGSAEFILSTIIGTPLYIGAATTNTIADICHSEDIRFSPAVWPASNLTNAPAAGGAYATWMRANGTGMLLYRMDGLVNVDTKISGYNVGLNFQSSTNGQPGCAFYNGWVTNCATAVLAEEMQTAEGLEFSDFTLDGDTAINRTHLTNDAAAQFDNCLIIGRNGTAVSCQGADWKSSLSFQNCVISNTVALAGTGVANFVNCRLLGSTQCVLGSNATCAAFTGCTFSPSQQIVNNGSASNLLINANAAMSNAMPVFDWTNIIANYATRLPARPALFVATSYGTHGNGTNDDTVAIQNALNAAGSAGGGIVYLPPGFYHTTNTLTVPGGVELRGPYEARHSTWPGSDNIFKGALIQPYGGQGSTSGPPAIVLSTNSGLVGMTIDYESQWTNCYAFPPAIQGQGPNVYMIGIQCPQPYYFVDLDTHTCTNHFLDMVDGWALQTGVHIGNGSSGTVVDCHANWTFWIDNFASPHALAPAFQAPVLVQVMNNLQYYQLGDCNELFVKDFSILENMYMHCSAENGVGPTFTGISAMCDATYQCFVFDSTAPCTFSDVNIDWLVSLNEGYANLTNQAAILTTSNFTGTVRMFNLPMWGSHNWDYLVNGGDVGLELVHLWQYAANGSQVNGGVFHLVNCGAFGGVDGAGNAPYQVAVGAAGNGGKTNELIGCFSYAGWNLNLQNLTNVEHVWMDYALSNNSVLNLGPLLLGDIYPNGLYQFEATNALTFQAYSPNGISSGNISVIVAATNLMGQGYVSNYTTANGLSVSGTAPVLVSVPLSSNATYNAVIKVTDASGYGLTNSWSFDTVSPAFTFEAEDFNYNGGSYFADPTPDEYAGLSSVVNIDYTNASLGSGSASYRPQGLETETAADKPRLAYAGYTDYDVGHATTGNWGDYTRSFPSGTYNLFIRSASPSGASDVASVALVTGGQGTTNQTLSQLGTFSAPPTGGWQAYGWAPLLNTNGQPVVFTGGSTETLRVATINGGYNVNYYMLVATNTEAPLLVRADFISPIPSQPIVLQMAVGPSSDGRTISLHWTGSADQLQPDIYSAASLTPPINWVLVTNPPVYANGEWTVTLPVGSSSAGYYRFQPQ